MIGSVAPTQCEKAEDSSSDDDDGAIVCQDSPPLKFREYRRGRELGRGATAQVFVCRRKSSVNAFAVKAVDLRHMQLRGDRDRKQTALHREVAILKALPPHPHIVQMVDVFQEADWFFIVLELVGGGDLFTSVTGRTPPRFLEPEAAYVLRQLGNAISFLHSQAIMHRDLKLENILVASERSEQSIVLYNVKITDFGLSKAVEEGCSKARSVVGTREYVSPEVQSGREYDFSSDLWCLGVVLYVLLAGQFPYKDIPAKQDQLDRIVERLHSPPCKCGDGARAMLMGLLQLDPAERFSLEAITSHRWLQDASEESPRAAKRPRILIKGCEGGPRTPSEDPCEELFQLGGVVQAGPQEVCITEGTKEWLALLFKSSRETTSVRTLGSSVIEEGVYPANLRPDLMQVYIALPSRFATILGKSGNNMKRIASTVGCKARMATNQEAIHHLVSVIGTYHQCTIVQEVLQGRLMDAARSAGVKLPDQVEVVVLVRVEAAGIIIGKQGFMLKQISTKSGARIQLLREQASGQRPCVLSGSLWSVLKAEKHVFHLMRSMPLGATPVDVLDLPWSPPPFSPALTCWASPLVGLETPFPSPMPSP